MSLAFAQRLAPGDRIRIVCEQEPTLSVERVLSPYGEVVLPLIGSVNLAGKYIVEAEDEIQRLAATKLRSDRILVAITLVVDQTSPVEFFGAVSRDGSLPFHAGLTLDDVVKLAGPTVAAATEAVEITGADGKKVIVDLTKNGGATKLHAGDRVFFPRAEESDEVIVLGGVVKPGSKPYKADLTIRALIELGGGLTAHAEGNKARLERKGHAPKIIDLESPDALAKLERGDVVVVPVLENGRYVTVEGFVVHPGLIEFREGMTLSQAIKAAGGVAAFAGSDSVTVKRMGEWKRRFDLDKLGSKDMPDQVLRPADLIEVPISRPRKPDEPKPKPRTGPVVPPR